MNFLCSIYFFGTAAHLFPPSSLFVVIVQSIIAVLFLSNAFFFLLFKPKEGHINKICKCLSKGEISPLSLYVKP